jgi:glycosyltransferase involved in cell wall biosynthesis
VEPGRTGGLCEPGAPESFASAVGELLTDPARAAAMGDAARAEALHRFHPRAVATRHVEIYRELLSSEA